MAPTHIETLKCTAAEGSSSILVVSKDKDVPMILLLSVSAGNIGITKASGDRFISIDRIDNVLRFLGFKKVHICLAFGMGGSDLSPATRRVTQKSYLQALEKFRQELRQVSATPVTDASEERVFVVRQLNDSRVRCDIQYKDQAIFSWKN